MKIITVANVKGGSTKSTLAIHLGEALSRRGRVLLIDLDAQGSLTDFCLPEASLDSLDRGNSYLLLAGESTLAEAIHPGLFCPIIPAVLKLAEIPALSAVDGAVMGALPPALKKAPFDFVLIDTPGSLGAELTTALVASDIVLVPVTPSRWTVRALAMLQNHMERVRKFPGAKKAKAFVVPSQFRKSQYHQDLRGDLERIPGFRLLEDIPHSESIKNRTENNSLLVPGSEPWQAFDRLAAEVASL